MTTTHISISSAEAGGKPIEVSNHPSKRGHVIVKIGEATSMVKADDLAAAARKARS